jgi:hypothetical protein
VHESLSQVLVPDEMRGPRQRFKEPSQQILDQHSGHDPRKAAGNAFGLEPTRVFCDTSFSCKLGAHLARSNEDQAGHRAAQHDIDHTRVEALPTDQDREAYATIQLALEGIALLDHADGERLPQPADQTAYTLLQEARRIGHVDRKPRSRHGHLRFWAE